MRNKSEKKKQSSFYLIKDFLSYLCIRIWSSYSVLCFLIRSSNIFWRYFYKFRPGTASITVVFVRFAKREKESLKRRGVITSQGFVPWQRGTRSRSRLSVAARRLCVGSARFHEAITYLFIMADSLEAKSPPKKWRWSSRNRKKWGKAR